jgi:hypothetical protein
MVSLLPSMVVISFALGLDRLGVAVASQRQKFFRAVARSL